MRRTAKPFTVEIKKRGPRRREGGDPVATEANGVAPWPDVPLPERGRAFQDAEKLFRGTEPRNAAPRAAPSITSSEEAQSSSPSRRILPDLVAEAALTEAAQSALPEPRRRGRPPRPRTDDAIHVHVRDEPVSAEPDSETLDVHSSPSPYASLPVLDLAASARRRAARSADNLPRGQRWKRRLPKVCW